MSEQKLEFRGVTFLPESYEEWKIDHPSDWMQLPKGLQSFYNNIDGLVAFNGGLHIRGLRSKPGWHSLMPYWKGAKALHHVYEELRPTDIPFAQDCLGDQFFLRLGTVWNLMAESGDVEDLELDFDGFIEACMDDPVDFLSLEPLIAFMGNGGELLAGELLVADPPFSHEAADYHMSKAPVEEQLEKLLDHYRKRTG